MKRNPVIPKVPLRLIDRALMAFWDTIIEAYPDKDHYELHDNLDRAFEKFAEQAVNEWLRVGYFEDLQLERKKQLFEDVDFESVFK